MDTITTHLITPGFRACFTLFQIASPPSRCSSSSPMTSTTNPRDWATTCEGREGGTGEGERFREEK